MQNSTNTHTHIIITPYPSVLLQPKKKTKTQCKREAKIDGVKHSGNSVGGLPHSTSTCMAQKLVGASAMTEGSFKLDGLCTRDWNSTYLLSGQTTRVILRKTRD